jgi:RimJ/RimL family protein N-acetyltransferase
MITFGFERLSLQRIYAHHMVRNPASGRVMEKAGMQREGVLRRHFYRWGIPEDVAIWGVLAETSS